MVFDRIKSPYNDHIYFDGAADQPRSSERKEESFLSFLFRQISFERLPTRFTIQRARNKDILLKECQRNSRDTLLSKTKLEKSDVAVRQNMNAVLDFIWKKDNMDIFYMPAEYCGTIALRIYDQFKRK
ncbi:hypothetical protein OUZ56_020457 [Daphnia magna]|uniref:Uncharacterized protein n=1 Tax=Daphnia magna TaxID=35525 RepID=A0ABQ9ZEI9_9CRUS|nr:hypothetical protein OUZ56_020457 [Daphnia magna]